MSRTTAKWLHVLSFIIAFILMLIFATNQTALIIILAVEFVICLILGDFLRCPKCRRSQGKSWFSAEYCPYCGASLYDE